MTTMTTNKNRTTGTIAAIIMLLATTVLINAQTSFEIFSNSDNSVVFRIDNLDVKNTPSKVLSVHDYNLIALKPTSAKENLFYSESTSCTINAKNSSTYSSAMLFAVEIENDMTIEDWMLQPFKTKNQSVAYLEPDIEGEITIEPWMTDVNMWRN